MIQNGDGRTQYHCAMHVTAYGSAGAILAENNLNDWTYPYGAANILKLIRKMVLTGEVDDSMGDMVEAVAVVNAGRMSLAEGIRAVRVAGREERGEGSMEWGVLLLYMNVRQR